ncbi:hypothetical protein ACLOJK_003992 [Asimina triloba]
MTAIMSRGRISKKKRKKPPIRICAPAPNPSSYPGSTLTLQRGQASVRANWSLAPFFPDSVIHDRSQDRLLAPIDSLHRRAVTAHCNPSLAPAFPGSVSHEGVSGKTEAATRVDRIRRLPRLRLSVAVTPTPEERAQPEEEKPGFSLMSQEMDNYNQQHCNAYKATSIIREYLIKLFHLALQK